MELRIDNGLTNGGWLFDRMNGLLGEGAEFSRMVPPVDVVENAECYQFSIELPGIKSESLDVRIDDGNLVVKAERKEPARAKETRVHRAERYYGTIERAFRLPDDVGHEAVKATYKDGVLEVSVPKLPEAKPLRIEVSYN